MTSPRHTFPKAEKLKSRKQIDLLFQGGKSFFAAPVKCYFRVDELTRLPVDELTSLRVDEFTSLRVYELTGLLVNELTGLPVDELIGGKGETTNVKPETSNMIYSEPVEGKSEMENMNHVSEQQNGTQTINNNQQIINIKAGVSVSKRNFKHSVDRNRIKRLLREAYRVHKHTLLEKLHTQNKTLEVFFVFTDKTLPDFAVVEEKMKYCIRRLGKIVEGGV